ncbi:DMT family transporter [Paraburkholderia sp.]|uniref:DMT family transporter n=1 Tax=Paraburkholderia sp. TaxID=1926495 RepID=UPI0023961252|nr:DMT family transporter [Paraburkholderia sp.]MDE1184241.1 DMT family transporter [Paraburkholderia sp.]
MSQPSHPFHPASRSPARRHERVALWSDLMLLAVAVVWGTSYGVVKSALVFYPVLGLLALRFGITFALLSPSLRALRHADARTLRGVVGAGGVLFAIFLCETFGVLLTRAANAAFLISLCVVLTPLLEWPLLKRKPGGIEWAAVSLSLVGAWLLAGDVSLTLNTGDLLILAAALLRALNVCLTRRVMRTSALPPLTVTAVQSGVVAIGSVVAALTVAPDQWRHVPSFAAHSGFWFSVVYLILACTLFAFFAQNYAIKRSSPTRVALLMGSEPAFGAVFACVWLGESIATRAWLGGGLIVAASLLATVRWRPASAAAAQSIEAQTP